MPKILDVDWVKLKHEYVAKGVPIRVLAQKYGVKQRTLVKKAWVQKWTSQRRQMQEKLDAKLTTAAVQHVANKAATWAEEQWQRCAVFRHKIMESMDQTGGPLDPQALDQLTKAEMRVDDMGRRSLGLANTVSQTDITSGGMPLSEFQDAMRSVAEMCAGKQGLSRQIDVEAIAAQPLED
jgi:hypothetical protein